MLTEGQLSTKGELQKQGGQQSAPGASMACTQYLLLTLGRAEDLYVMLLRTITQEDSWAPFPCCPSGRCWAGPWVPCCRGSRGADITEESRDGVLPRSVPHPPCPLTAQTLVWKESGTRPLLWTIWNSRRGLGYECSLRVTSPDAKTRPAPCPRMGSCSVICVFWSWWQRLMLKESVAS